MAFATGHNPPAGFVAGQLRDGASFGSIDAANFNNQPAKFLITLRYYKNTLIAVVAVTKPDGTVIEQPTIKQAQYLTNISGLALPNQIQALKDLAGLVATPAKLSAIGLAENQLVPVNPTNDLIPFEMTADGLVKSFVSPADVAKQQAAAATTQQNLLTTLANSVTTGATTTTTATDGTTTTTTGMSTMVKVIIAVIAAVVVGGIIYMATKKKKPGRR